MQRKRWMLTLVCGLSVLGFGTVNAEAPDLLLRLDTASVPATDLASTVRVLKDLGDWAVALAGPEERERLTERGVAFQVLDTDPAGKEYYFVYGRDPEQLLNLGALGDVLCGDSHRALVRSDAQRAELIAGLGLELAKVFMEPIRPVPESQLAAGGILSVHPEIQDMVDAVSSASLEGLVNDLVAFGTRKSNTAGGVAASQYIFDEFASYGITDVSFHDFDTNADNVVAVIPGTVFPENIFVLGGHYDSIASFSTTAPGADDNASGTAAVLEAARIMKDYPFENTLVFIAFASEEFGLIGSAHYASEARARGDNIIGMINVDMIGYLASGDAMDVDIIAGSGSSGLRELAFWATEQYVPGFPAIVGSGMIGGTSDFESFTSNGFPAIWPFEDMDHDSPYIHTPNDVVGTSLNSFPLAVNCTKSIVATLASLAEPVDNLAIGHTPLEDTTDTTSPYPVVAQVVSVEPLAAGFPVLHYAANDGAYTAVSMTATGNPDEYEAEIPAQALNTTVGYYLEAEDINGLADTSPAAAPAKVYEFDVAESSSGWALAKAAASTVGPAAGGGRAVTALAAFLLPALLLLSWRRRARPGE